MKRTFLAIVLLLLLSPVLRAQDTTAVRTAVDSTLVGKDILTVIGHGVTVNQSQAVRSAFQRYVTQNASKTLSGYRIRVFYDNGQTARSKSEGIEHYIRSQYPGLGVYRTFESPNYKVSVGDFRTKEEALQIYNSLKAVYPTAYIIKETINYPR